METSSNTLLIARLSPLTLRLEIVDRFDAPLTLDYSLDWRSDGC